MNKKLLFFILSVTCLALSLNAFAAETVYLDGVGTDANCYTSLVDAVNAVDDGGTVVLTADYTTTATVNMPAKNVTITSQNNAVLYLKHALKLGGNTTFKNIKIDNVRTSTNYLYCLGYDVTICEDVTLTNSGGKTVVIFAGNNNKATCDLNNTITVKNGAWGNVYLGGYYATDVCTGNVTLNIHGDNTSIGNLKFGNNNNVDMSVNAIVNVYGGTVADIKQTSGATKYAYTANLFGGTVNKISVPVTVDLTNGGTVTISDENEQTVTTVAPDGYEVVKIGSAYSVQKIEAEATSTVYVDGVGEAEGTYKDLVSAVAAIRNGGTVVVSGNVKVDSETAISAGGKVLITSCYDGEDYTDTAALKLSSDIVLNTAVTFKDITLDKASTGNVNIVAKGNELVIDEGVYCRNTLASNYIILVGGAKSGTFEGNSNITVKSGYFRSIYGGNTNGTFKGNSTVNFLGGYVDHMITGGSFMGNFEGDSTVNIGGDAVFVGADTSIGVMGACCGSGSSSYTFAGDIHLNFYDSARVNSNVFGTTRYSNVTTTGNVYITVKDDAYIYSNLYAGGYTGTLNGNTSVVMDGGWVGINLSAGSRGGTVNGDTYLEVNGGQINYYYTNYHSSYSKTAGEYNVGGGGLR